MIENHKKITRKIKSPALNFIAFTFAVAFLYVSAPIAITLLFSLFLFLLLDPLVSHLEKIAISRVFSAPLLIILSMGLLFLVGLAFYKSLMSVASQLPDYSDKFTAITTQFHQTTSTIVNQFISTSKSAPKMQIDSAATSNAVTSFLWRGMNSALALLSVLLFIPILTLFALIQKEYLKERLIEISGNPGFFERTCLEIKSMTRGFFFGNFAVGLLMTAIFAIAFLIMKLDHPFSLALFAGFLNLIPIFGLFLGAILPAIQAFIQIDGLTAVMAVFLLSAGVHFVANDLIIPKFIGTRINVNSTVVVVGLLFWGALWGGVGLFLTLPLMGILRIILFENETTRPYANLIADRPRHPKPAQPHHSVHAAASSI